MHVRTLNRAQQPPGVRRTDIRARLAGRWLWNVRDWAGRSIEDVDDLSELEQPRCPRCGAVMRDVPGGYECAADETLILDEPVVE